MLTEVPEMFGAETILMNRCVNEEVFDKTVSLINDFKDYFTSHNQVVYENPSPGNKKGGITTLEDKSLGCVQKSGSADVEDVIEIGGRVTRKGLNLLTGHCCGNKSYRVGLPFDTVFNRTRYTCGCACADCENCDEYKPCKKKTTLD